MREIPLTQGKVALVDDADYEWLSGMKWCASLHSGIWYAMRANGNGGTVFMHQVIMGKTGKPQTDHVDRNGLNNQRVNLRPATTGENAANRYRARVIAPYRGLVRNKVTKAGSWVAQIKKGDVHMYLGTFPTAEGAARAYDAKARELFGEFAVLNFP